MACLLQLGVIGAIKVTDTNGARDRGGDHRPAHSGVLTDRAADRGHSFPECAAKEDAEAAPVMG